MRTAFVNCDTIEEAMEECPWASATLELNGGFMCFESWSDYNIAVGTMQ